MVFALDKHGDVWVFDYAWDKAGSWKRLPSLEKVKK